jgi:hypothetical protein
MENMDRGRGRDGAGYGPREEAGDWGLGRCSGAATTMVGRCFRPLSPRLREEHARELRPLALWPPSSLSRAATAMVAGRPDLLLPLLVLIMAAGRVLREEARPCSPAAGLAPRADNASPPFTYHLLSRLNHIDSKHKQLDPFFLCDVPDPLSIA